MSENTIADVTLDLDDSVEEEPAVESSTTETRKNIVTEKEAEKQEVEAEEAENESDGEESEEDASPVEDSREEKPEKGDMVPRARLNEEILKKKKQKEEIQREREAREKAERELEEFRKQQQAMVAEAAPFPSESDADVDYDPQKLKTKIAKWHSDEVARQVAALDAQKQTQSMKQKAMEQSKAFDMKLQAYANEHPEYVDDFKEAGDPAWPRHIDDAVRNSDYGPQLDHYLLKNKDERERILAMPPAKALMEIGVIQHGIANPQPKKKASPKQTKAPRPIEDTRGGPTAKFTAILDGYDIE